MSCPQIGSFVCFLFVCFLNLQLSYPNLKWKEKEKENYTNPFFTLLSLTHLHKFEDRSFPDPQSLGEVFWNFSCCITPCASLLSLKEVITFQGTVDLPVFIPDWTINSVTPEVIGLIYLSNPSTLTQCLAQSRFSPTIC